MPNKRKLQSAISQWPRKILGEPKFANSFLKLDEVSAIGG